MGINDEYSRDAYLGDHYAYNSDEDSDDVDSQLDPEDWQAMYSDELLDAWTIIYETLSQNYLAHTVKYTQFIEFIMEPWRWTARSPPTVIHSTLWARISAIDVISKRILPEQFHGWSQQYLRELV